jgi:tetratricopeptide (TPR) repeat protein
MRRDVLLICGCLLLLSSCRVALGDIVHLRNGKTLNGEVIKEDDDYIIVRVPYGEVKLKQADVEGIERQTPTEYRLDLGRQLLQQRQYDRAVAALEEAYAGNKQSIEARRVLCTALWAQGTHYRILNRYREARDALEKLIKLDPQAELVQHTAQKDLAAIGAGEKELTARIDEARSHGVSKDWLEAIRLYEEIVQISPDARARVAGELAQCHVGLAVDLSQKKKISDATSELESALKLDPTLADKLERFYTSCALPAVLTALERGELNRAQSDLQRVLAFAPTNRSVLYVAGRLNEALGKIEEAADCYARALKMRVGNATHQYVADLRAELEKSLELKPDLWKIDNSVTELSGFAKTSDGPAEKLETEHFVIYHYNETLAAQVAEAVEYHLARVMSELGLTNSWKGKAAVYIHRTQAEYTASTGQPEWTGGFSRYSAEGNRIKDLQIHSWQTSPRLLKSVLPHEITHLIVYVNLPDVGFLPRSIHEGFAVLMEPPFRHDYFRDFLRSRLKSQDYIPLADLLAAQNYPRDPEFFYAEGYALIQYLVQAKGIQATTGLIKHATAAGFAPGELLKISGARSLDDLEGDWKIWLGTADGDAKNKMKIEKMRTQAQP